MAVGPVEVDALLPVRKHHDEGLAAQRAREVACDRWQAVLADTKSGATAAKDGERTP